MNFYAIPSLITALFCLGCGILVLERNPRARLNRIFSFLCLVFFLWAFSEFVYRFTPDESVALLWVRIEGVAWSLFPAFLLHFFIIFSQREAVFLKKFRYYLILYLPSIIFAALCLVSDLLVAPKVELRYWGYQEFVGDLFFLYVIYYLIYCLIGLFLCFQVAKEAKEKSLRRQAQIIFVFFLLALVSGTITDAIFPLLKIETFISVNHFLFISIVGVAFALERYKTFPPGYRSLIFKFSFVLAFILLLFWAPLSYWIYKKISNEARESLRRELMTIASIGSKLIDVEKHEMIRSPEDEDTPLYEEARAGIKELIKSNPLIDDIYTVKMSKKKNIVYFVLDAWDTQDKDGNGIIEPDEERAHVGEEYDISEMPEFQRGFNEVSADYAPICDKWGCWLSGYAPLLDKEGKIVAVVGVDMSAQDVVKVESEAKKATLIFIFSVSLAILILFSFAIWYFLKPIKQLEKDIGRFAQDINYRSELKTYDEFDLLVAQFNKMAERISGIHKELEEKIKERTKELQKANKKLEEIDRMRREFVSHIAHELRTPLNVFRWSIELLKSGDLGKINLKQKEVLEQVYQANLRLINLVNDLLQIARIDEIRFKITPAPCQIEELIEAVSHNLFTKIKEKRLDFVWEKPEPLLPKVRADKDKIFEVILNILDNAVKFTPEDGKIEVKTSLTDKIAPKEILKKYGFIQKDKQYVLISISDTGMGIPKIEQEKVFSRFFRGSNVKKAGIEGTGLGMAIVFEIIKMHNGAIWFESKEGVGTKFYFTLPIA